MKIRGYISLIIFSVSIVVGGSIVDIIAETDFTTGDLIVSASVFALISFVTLNIFFKGQKKAPESQTLHSLVAISVKLLLEMLFALIWFIVAKKIGLQLVLLFFVLYLAFTLYSVFIIVKTLKTKSIDNKFRLENV
jgi:hypothetical protein